ncbi:hypothetical protein IV203_009852 [Nitzschia inconspicua]|uniref:Uncharacterized protein n=1 Tax=Nitzschia inconspicua TaxID=303405 RepID=A0A9K3KVE2_9STRA|nr:hypothetical protein IV203_009852 [Nitzschia inconspicua]
MLLSLLLSKRTQVLLVRTIASIWLFLSTPRALAFYTPREYGVMHKTFHPSASSSVNVHHSCSQLLLHERLSGSSARPLSTAMYYGRREDNLFSGLAEIGIGFSIGVLWSEYSVILTGCGPLNFSDALERVCYQGVIALSGVALFNRIVAGKSLELTVEEWFGPLLDTTLVQIRIAEYSSAMAVGGAFLTLAVQYQSGANMDGLSGIDVSLCRAIRDF